MNHRFIISLLIAIGGYTSLYSQVRVSGIVYSNERVPIEAASVGVKGMSIGTATDVNGQFTLTVNIADSILLQFQHVAFIRKELWITKGTSENIVITLKEKDTMLRPVEISGKPGGEAGLVAVSAKSFLEAPSGSNDISSVLKTLPGVVSNNELSANYSVRGGSFDENLIFINEIPVYRPFLISNGRQEGLGTVNPDLLSGIEFSSGGWSSKYGGKLSSVLKATYKRPYRNRFSASVGMLGGDVSAEIRKKKWGILLGSRYKSSQYLLNTLDTQGQYQPRFGDAQMLINYDFSSKTQLTAFINYSRNRFLVVPENQITEFGTFNQSFRLFVAFDGREIMNYDTWQGALNLTHSISDRWQIRFIGSRVDASEEEITDLEGGYRLCDIDRNSNRDEDCLILRGIGTNYRYARNKLDADIWDFRLISDHQIDLNNELSWGLEYKQVDIDDNVSEYTFIDSADYVTDLTRFKEENLLSYYTFTAFVSMNKDWNNNRLEYGLRIIHPELTNEWLWAPRLSYTKRFSTSLRMQAAVGIYHQPPFYRELRNRSGNLQTGVNSQSALHIITGLEKNLEIWDRPFEWKAEAYYKYLWNSIPYDVDNVRIRYLPDLLANGKIMGFDSRIGGEFIPGTESWFSLGLLSAREDILQDERGFIRKPTDQRMTMAILFRDYFPNNPSMRVTMNLQVGTGLPFGPPNDLSNRNIFTARMYRRFDLGFTKEFEPSFGNIYLSLEILNVLGVDNVITYNWITDVVNQQIAVPNALSGRFFNLKLRVSL